MKSRRPELTLQTDYLKLLERPRINFCVVSRNLEKPHWKRSFSVTLFVCSYAFMFKSFLIYMPDIGRIFFKAVLVVSFFKGTNMNEKRSTKKILFQLCRNPALNHGTIIRTITCIVILCSSNWDPTKTEWNANRPSFM